MTHRINLIIIIWKFHILKVNCCPNFYMIVFHLYTDTLPTTKLFYFGELLVIVAIIHHI